MSAFIQLRDVNCAQDRVGLQGLGFRDQGYESEARTVKRQARPPVGFWNPGGRVREGGKLSEEPDRTRWLLGFKTTWSILWGGEEVVSAKGGIRVGSKWV